MTENTKFSKSPLDKYTEKQYNDFGWARHAEALSRNELDDMYSKIQEKGSLKRFSQSSNGETIIEVNDKPYTTLEANNTFLFVKGTENEPEITRVVKVNFFDEDSIDVFRKDIYEHSDHKSLEAYARALGEETIRYYDRSSSANYREYTNQSRSQQSGRKSKGNPRTNRTWTWRDGTFEETKSNDIAPINETSSTDGVFFDGEKTKNSLSIDGEAPVKHGNFNISGDDVRLEAPVREDIGPVQEDASKTGTTTPTVEQVASVDHGVVADVYF